MGVGVSVCVWVYVCGCVCGCVCARSVAAEQQPQLAAPSSLPTLDKMAAVMTEGVCVRVLVVWVCASDSALCKCRPNPLPEIWIVCARGALSSPRMCGPMESSEATQTLACIRV